MLTRDVTLSASQPAARRQEPRRDPVPAADLAAVRAGERRPDPLSGNGSHDARLLRPAVDLGADDVRRQRREELRRRRLQAADTRQPSEAVTLEAGCSEVSTSRSSSGSRRPPSRSRAATWSTAWRRAASAQAERTAPRQRRARRAHACAQGTVTPRAETHRPPNRGARVRRRRCRDLLPLGARAVSSRYHDDSLWANSLRSLGGLQTPFDFDVFLRAGERCRDGESPYVDPDAVISEGQPAPYVYPPVLASPGRAADAAARNCARLLDPGHLVHADPDRVHGRCATCARCRRLALLPRRAPVPGHARELRVRRDRPVLALLVALGWRYRDHDAGVARPSGPRSSSRSSSGRSSSGSRRPADGSCGRGAAGTAVALALLVVGRRSASEVSPSTRRSCDASSDVEAENSYSAFALLRASSTFPELAARGIVVVGVRGLLFLAWRAARASRRRMPDEQDRRSLTLALAAGVRAHAHPLASLPRPPRRADRAGAPATLGALVRTARAHGVRGARLVPRLAAR